jgi:cytochrome c556
MHRVIVGVVGLAAIVVIASVVVTRQTTPRTQADGAGLAKSAEIIEARRVLMRQIQQLMKPIDAFTVEETGDLPALRSAAAAIEAMMLAFPHLFPPATNLFDSSLSESPTTALPAVWDAFSTFRTFAETSERAAAAAAASTDAQSLRSAGRALRASCDGCHARFAKPYTPPRVTQEDLDFDFDSIFEKR